MTTFDQQESSAAKPELVWGASKIAPYLGRTEKGTFCALESGKVPGARKVAGRWVLNLKVFYGSFETVAA
jgi:hypothetical protein